MDNDVQEIGQKEPAEKRHVLDARGNPTHLPLQDPPKSPGRGKDTVKRAPATPEEVRALLFMVLDQKTSEAMVRSLRKRISRGNTATLEFLFDRIIGRPAVNVHHEADGALAQFIGAWQELVVDANLVQAPPLALTDAEYRTLDADMPTEDDELDDNDDSAQDDAK